MNNPLLFYASYILFGCAVAWSGWLLLRGYIAFHVGREMEREAAEERAKAREYKRRYWEEYTELNMKVKALNRMLNNRNLN